MGFDTVGGPSIKVTRATPANVSWNYGECMCREGAIVYQRASSVNALDRRIFWDGTGGCITPFSYLRTQPYSSYFYTQLATYLSGGKWSLCTVVLP